MTVVAYSDMWRWQHDPDRGYSIRGAYQLLTSQQHVTLDKVWFIYVVANWNSKKCFSKEISNVAKNSKSQSTSSASHGLWQVHHPFEEEQSDPESFAYNIQCFGCTHLVWSLYRNRVIFHRGLTKPANINVTYVRERSSEYFSWLFWWPMMARKC
jgi:hypothetical protein